jgi:uncharacterized membrane protein
MDTPHPVVSATPTTESSLVTWTTVIYALHACSIVIGIVTVATIVTVFLLGWPSIIAVILNYVKREDARGTWLESHFRWQIRTFWFALLWAVLSLPFIMVFTILTLGIGWYVAWVPLGVWLMYRIARGWMKLTERQPMYA